MEILDDGNSNDGINNKKVKISYFWNVNFKENIIFYEEYSSKKILVCKLWKNKFQIEVTVEVEKEPEEKDWWAQYLKQEVNKCIRENWEDAHKVFS